MERGLYNLGILAYRALIQLASIRSEKAQKWVSGRQNWRKILKAHLDPSKKRLLVHAASLGEMEQGLPILKALRTEFPDHQIVLSFFSPSGYEFFKEEELCDLKIYLPLDRPQEARDFAQLLKPELCLFIKYEIWPNLIRALKKEGSKIILAPAHFRKNQIYFKPYAQKWLGQSLRLFDAIMVQNQESFKLLQHHGLSNISLSGDSRFDRALENKALAFESSHLEEFIGHTPCLIIGSSWPKEESLCLELLEQNSELKVILAPHEVDSPNIKRLAQLFERYTPNIWSEKRLNPNSQLLIIDSIGQLKYLYRFANIALIGGGFGKGIHSTVEAAVYNIPLLFGPAHRKFPEAQEMIDLGLARSIQAQEALAKPIAELLAGSKSEDFHNRFNQFISSKEGASDHIVQKVKELLGPNAD